MKHGDDGHKEDPGVWVAIGFTHDFYGTVRILGAFRAREAAVRAILDATAASYIGPVDITESAVFAGAVCLGRVRFCVPT